MPRPLVDLLWRDSPAAPSRGRRGPRARHSTGDVVEQAVAIADADGLAAVTVRALAQALGMTTMSVYTHVNSRDDLLVLMADLVHVQARREPFGRTRWRTRVRRVAVDNHALFHDHPWLLEVDDPRTALGPGTIAKYDHELHAFDGTALGDVERDAALAFVLDHARSAATRALRATPTAEFADVWAASAGSLAGYLGGDFPLAQRVGGAAGEELGAPYDAARAWEFGLDRVLAGLGELVERAEG